YDHVRIHDYSLAGRLAAPAQGRGVHAGQGNEEPQASYDEGPSVASSPGPAVCPAVVLRATLPSQPGRGVCRRAPPPGPVFRRMNAERVRNGRTVGRPSVGGDGLQNRPWVATVWENRPTGVARPEVL